MNRTAVLILGGVTLLGLVLIGVVMARGGGEDDPNGWTIADIIDNRDVLESVEQRWQEDLDLHGSNIDPEASRCYFQVDHDDFLRRPSRGTVVCGPVTHWVGSIDPPNMPEPDPTTRGLDGEPEWADGDYWLKQTRRGHWDIYRFDSWETAEFGQIELEHPIPMFHGVTHQSPLVNLDDLWHPDGEEPPQTFDEVDTSRPEPPPHAIIELEDEITLDLDDLDETYGPEIHSEDDLEVSYALNIVGGSWDASTEGMRRLRLHVDADIEATDGYDLTMTMGDSATATTENEESVAALTEGARTSYPIGDDHDHPDLIFALPEDTTTVEIELSPRIRAERDRDQYSPFDQDAPEPRHTTIDLEPEHITIPLTD